MRFVILAVFVYAAPIAALAQTCDTQRVNKSWAKCSACHSVDPSVKTMLGPNLHGLSGRVAGKLPEYKYSPAMGASEITWTKELFDAFIAAPQKVIPGNRMPFAGLSAPADREALACMLQLN